jgi:hypothetical protein
MRKLNSVPVLILSAIMIFSTGCSNSTQQTKVNEISEVQTEDESESATDRSIAVQYEINTHNRDIIMETLGLEQGEYERIEELLAHLKYLDIGEIEIATTETSGPDTYLYLITLDGTEYEVVVDLRGNRCSTAYVLNKTTGKYLITSSMD